MDQKSYIDPHLPLIDLHRHLDGSIRLETIIELAQEQGIDLPAYDVESLRPHVVIDGKADGLMDFIGRFRYLTAILHDLDACRRVAYENVEDAQREGIDYIELRFSPWFMSETHDLDPAGVVDAVADGIIAAERDTGVRAQMIGIMSRTYDTPSRRGHTVLSSRRASASGHPRARGNLRHQPRRGWLSGHQPDHLDRA